jgi:hypothetical protein
MNRFTFPTRKGTEIAFLRRRYFFALIGSIAAGFCISFPATSLFTR